MSIARRVLDLQTNVAHLIDYNQDKTNLPKDPDLLVYKLQLSLITGNKPN
jgi:type I restriction enzyme R subunit